MIDFTVIGSHIKYYRNKRGYSQAELAEKIGSSVPYISYVETGKKQIGVCKFEKVIFPRDTTTSIAGFMIAIYGQLKNTSAQKKRWKKTKSDSLNYLKNGSITFGINTTRSE